LERDYPCVSSNPCRNVSAIGHSPDIPYDPLRAMITGTSTEAIMARKITAT